MAKDQFSSSDPKSIVTTFQHGKVRITFMLDHVTCVSDVITFFWILNLENQSSMVKPSILTHNYLSTLSSWQGWLHAKFLIVCHG
jgi:hypothetical protein